MTVSWWGTLRSGGRFLSVSKVLATPQRLPVISARGSTVIFPTAHAVTFFDIGNWKDGSAPPGPRFAHHKLSRGSDQSSVVQWSVRLADFCMVLAENSFFTADC